MGLRDKFGTETNLRYRQVLSIGMTQKGLGRGFDRSISLPTQNGTVSTCTYILLPSGDLPFYRARFNYDSSQKYSNQASSGDVDALISALRVQQKSREVRASKARLGYDDLNDASMSSLSRCLPYPHVTVQTVYRPGYI
jgi:hypothetical protein